MNLKMQMIQFVSIWIWFKWDWWKWFTIKKHFDPRISTFRGIKIDWSDEDENASDSIRVKCESDSNVIDESELQYEKHFNSRISIFRLISTSDDFEKFRINLWWRISIRKQLSITKISFPDSIEIDDNLTPINAEPSMNWTFRGITIDSSDEFENAEDSIRINLNLIQMRLMKGIHKMKNMMNQEFEQSKESQLIELMIHKMQKIQFGSIVN
jgi:hypothetical protein